MDATTLLQVLEHALATSTLSRAHRPFVMQCLPDLRRNTLDSDDRAELERIAAALALPDRQPSAINASGSEFGNNATVAGRDVNQGVQMSDGTVYGAVVGTNLGTIIYGADLNTQRREHMVRYLHRLANEKAVLQLRGLAGNLKEGLQLPDVYVLLATQNYVEVARGSQAQLAAFFDKKTLKADYDPHHQGLAP